LYPEGTEIITDIGSGLNFKRKGLKTILERAIAGDIKELVVAHKDRLCRFGFELLEFIISKYSNGTIMVLDDKTSSTETEFANDILQILTVFSARLNGRRKYKKKESIDETPENKVQQNAESSSLSIR
jgi:predicted site-specific integrase-resolvase